MKYVIVGTAGHVDHGKTELTRALTPAYLRVGGSESDKAYYDLGAGQGVGRTVPRGYESAMTAGQWDAIQGFVARNNLGLVFTLNAGPAARDRQGRWQGPGRRISAPWADLRIRDRRRRKPSPRGPPTVSPARRSSRRRARGPDLRPRKRRRQ